MSFFEELGALMKKYNFELHPIQIDENVARFNEVFKTNVKKEDLPPPVLLFRTSEGDFIPTTFGPVTLRNAEQNVHFINIAEPTKVIDMFSTEKKIETSKQEQMNWEEVKEEPKKRGRKKKEEKKVESVGSKKVLIVGPLFKGQNFNIAQYNKFVDTNLGKLSAYNTINTLLPLVIGDKNYTENEPIKANSKRGKEVISDLCEKYVKEFGEIVLLKGWDKALEAKKIKEFAEANNIFVVEQKDF